MDWRDIRLTFESNMPDHIPCLCNSWYVDKGPSCCGTEEAWKSKSSKEFPVGEEIATE